MPLNSLDVLLFLDFPVLDITCCFSTMDSDDLALFHAFPCPLQYTLFIHPFSHPINKVLLYCIKKFLWLHIHQLNVEFGTF